MLAAARCAGARSWWSFIELSSRLNCVCMAVPHASVPVPGECHVPCAMCQMPQASVPCMLCVPFMCIALAGVLLPRVCVYARANSKARVGAPHIGSGWSPEASRRACVGCILCWDMRP